jgi:uncharacterized protein YjbJ (UPF0337 family)
MGADEAKGKAEDIKGRIKEGLGAVTGNKDLEAEGSVERAKGAAREKVLEDEGDVDADRSDSG